MAITFVGAGGAVTGVNVPLNPLAHASTVVGDVVLIVAAIRNNGVGVPATPVGWTRTATFGAASNVQVFARVWDGAWAMPTVTFTGGAASEDTLAQAATFRGAQIRVMATASTTNVSAANITMPAATAPGRNNCLAIYVGWKKDDWTGAAVPAGLTEIGEVVSTAGNDAAFVWDYQIQTTAANTVTGSWVITGGVSAVGASGVLVLDSLAAVAVTAQDEYPPRNLISVTGLNVGDTVEIYRVVGGERTLIRAGSEASTPDVAFLRVDAEFPFGVPVSYVVVVEGTEYATSSATYQLPGGKVVLSDAITGAAAEVTIMAWPERTFSRRSTTFRVGRRNVVVSGELGGFEGTIELYTEATSSRDNFMDLIETATEGVVQIRQPGGYDGVDGYVAVNAVTERRHSQDGTDDRRRFVLDVVEVEGWAENLEAAGYTYADLEAVYTGQTYADLAADYATYLALAQADLS